MSAFIFDEYGYDQATKTARFSYRFDNGQTFTEQVVFAEAQDAYDQAILDRVLFLAFVLIGTSYYKTAPSREVRFVRGVIDEWQAGFLNHVYQEGLSQFAFENNLTRDDLAHFQATGTSEGAVPYQGSGILSLQSGGKDSLLVAQKLRRADQEFTSFYISSSSAYPAVIDRLSPQTYVATRILDREALAVAKANGALNGHVPVTYIVMAISLIQAVLTGKDVVLAAIGHEGEEPHAWVGDLPINHQWSKTWQGEQLFVEYVRRYVSPNLRVGSPLRQYSELSVTKQFTELAWADYSTSFSSCNVANYQQGANNTQLTWCGHCPKCANSYLLFAPFVDSAELQIIFGGDLFGHRDLDETFKGLLGMEGVMKPFECVGETEELRHAYHMAQARGGYGALPFAVPESSFDIEKLYPAQDFTDLLA